MKRAFVFPGQGAQAVGMGKALADDYPQSREVFDEVNDALGRELSAIIWNGPIEELTLTANAQPALLATSIAVLKAIGAEHGSRFQPAFVAGHSLGEYSALCAAGSITLSDAARLLEIRGKAMQEAVPVGEGAMAALLGLGYDDVAGVAKEASQGEVCEAANDNDPKQVVVSGHRSAVERAVEIARERGARRAVMLPVSAPFHCRLMEPATETMRAALEDANITEPSCPLVSNVAAKPVSSPSEIKDLLVRQIEGTVRWRESVMWMAANGVGEIWEIGVGNALTGMIRRIDRSVATRSVGGTSDLANLSAES